jgi:hypothetical protein
MSNEHAAKGTEHLQRAARELIGAARSFLDAAEELVEDSDFVEDAASAIRSMAEDLGSLARRDGEPRETQGGQADAGSAPGGAESDQTATGSAERTTKGGDAVSSTRVRRIDVE